MSATREIEFYKRIFIYASYAAVSLKGYPLKAISIYILYINTSSIYRYIYIYKILIYIR